MAIALGAAAAQGREIARETPAILQSADASHAAENKFNDLSALFLDAIEPLPESPRTPVLESGQPDGTAVIEAARAVIRARRDECLKLHELLLKHLNYERLLREETEKRLTAAHATITQLMGLIKAPK